MSVTLNSAAAGVPASTAVTGSSSLTSQVSGILPVANGGTGTITGYAGSTVLTTQVSGILPIANGGTGTVNGYAGSTVLTTQVSGILPIANGGTGTVTGFAGSTALATQVSGILPEVNGGTGTGSSINSAWVAYTPTIVGAVPTNINFRSRRLGPDLLIMGYFNGGAFSGSNLTFTLGYNGADQNVTTATFVGSTMNVGMWGRDTTAGASGPGSALLCGSNYAVVGFAYSDATHSGLQFEPGTIMAANSNVSVRASVPIQGW